MMKTRSNPCEITKILRNHISWHSSDDIQEICKPFFEKFQLNYFDYARTYYKDLSSVILVSDNVWYEHYFKNKYHLSTSIYDSGIHLWNNYLEKPAEDAREYFNYTNGISIFKKYDDYCELFDFAAPHTNRKVMDFYLNNLNLLYAFTDYFKDKANELIKKSELNRLIVPKENIGIQQYSDIDESRSFISSLMRIPNFPLSKRECTCLFYLVRGRTAAEIAKALFISKRTVETHIENIKTKLKCRNKSEIFDKAFEFGIGLKLL